MFRGPQCPQKTLTKKQSMAESVIFHCKGCKIWPTDIQSIQKWKWNSINHFMTIFILIICYWVTYQPKFSSLRHESFCEGSVVQGLGRALVGSFLVGGSASSLWGRPGPGARQRGGLEAGRVLTGWLKASIVSIQWASWKLHHLFCPGPGCHIA